MTRKDEAEEEESVKSTETPPTVDRGLTQEKDISPNRHIQAGAVRVHGTTLSKQKGLRRAGSNEEVHPNDRPWRALWRRNTSNLGLRRKSSSSHRDPSSLTSTNNSNPKRGLRRKSLEKGQENSEMLTAGNKDRVLRGLQKNNPKVLNGNSAPETSEMVTNNSKERVLRGLQKNQGVANGSDEVTSTPIQRPSLLARGLRRTSEEWDAKAEERRNSAITASEGETPSRRTSRMSGQSLIPSDLSTPHASEPNSTVSSSRRSQNSTPGPQWFSLEGAQPDDFDPEIALLTLHDLDEEAEAVPTNTSAGPTPQLGTPAELAVATPLEDEDTGSLQQARPIERNSIESKTGSDDHPPRRYALLGIGVVSSVLLVIGTVVAVTSRNKSPDDASSEVTTIIPRKDTLLELFPAETQHAMMHQPGSPQHRAFQWLQEDPFLEGYTDQRIRQRGALMTLFYSAGGEDWYHNDGWGNYEAEECEDWFFKRSFQLSRANFSVDRWCNEDGQLENLWLYNNQLRGPLAPEVCLLTSLKTIPLHSNYLSGTIPPCLGDLSHLEHLMLVSNRLVGTIPSELGGLTQLSTLILFANDLSGTIPSQLGLLDQLQVLWAEQNQLTGTIPTSIGNMRNLITLSLSENQLTGSIPIRQMGQLEKLQYLGLALNSLSGSLPSEVGTIQARRILFHWNHLTGTLPTELGLLPSFQGDKLAPANKYLSDITPTLFVNSNKLNGAIPSEIGRCVGLEKLRVDVNELASSLPSELGAMRDLNIFSASRNALTGPIATDVGRLTSLQSMWLYGNQLTSSLPTELGDMFRLQALYAYDNQLTGPIPSQLTLLSDLVLFQMGNNDLSGKIPEAFGDLPSLTSFEAQGNIRLSGTIPSGLCRLENDKEKSSASLRFNCSSGLCGCASCACT